MKIVNREMYRDIFIKKDKQTNEVVERSRRKYIINDRNKSVN